MTATLAQPSGAVQVGGEVIHKLYPYPTPRTGYLNELILCWRELDITRGETYPTSRIKFCISINDVTCIECRDIWANQWP